MNERVSSVLVKGLNYDFEFNENTLNKQDMSLETDVHTIKVFGKDYLIGMGGVMNHPDNDALSYFIAYLIYNKKVVCKLGIYEILNESDEQEELDHRSVDFSSLRLIVDNHYYEEPKILESYTSTIEDIDTKEEDSKSEGEAEPKNAGVEESKNAGVEESKGDEPSIDTIKIYDDFVAFLTEEFKKMGTYDIKSTNKDPDEINLSKNYSSNNLRNLMIMYRSYIFPLAYTDEKILKSKKNEIYKLFKKMYPNKKDKTPFYPEDIIDKSDTGNQETVITNKLNIHILLVIEYYLNLKVIINGKNTFSLYGHLEDPKKKLIKVFEDTNVSKTNYKLFKLFDPTYILYLTVEDDTIVSTVMKTLEQLNEEEKEYLKYLINKSDHEFVFESQLESIKQIVS